MAYAAPKSTKPGLEESQEQIHKIRITLSSKHVQNLEKGMILCTQIVSNPSRILFYFRILINDKPICVCLVW